MRSKQRGVNRIELALIAVAIGVLVAVVAIKLYQDHASKTRFAEVVTALAPYKAAIEKCAKDGTCVAAGALSGLAPGTLGVPPAISTTYLARVAVASNGTITATASKAGGLAGETFILTPNYLKGAPLTWTVTGTCKTRSGGAIC